MLIWSGQNANQKIWDGQNANQRDKSGQNANLWLALCPVGILSGLHFVRTPLITTHHQHHVLSLFSI